MSEQMLRVEGLQTRYGSSQVLFGVDLEINSSEVVSLLGRNGMGKTTTVRSIMGMTAPFAGNVIFKSAPLHNQPSYKVARAGLGLVPEGRQIFSSLTVRENLRATAKNSRAAKSPWNEERIYKLFPRLLEQAKSYGNRLSGGEQQMLAVGRALMTNPELLILDEATEGLAPLIRQEIWTCLQTLKGEGLAILLIDKNIEVLKRICDRHHIMEKGRIVWSGTSADLETSWAECEAYLGVGA